MNTKSSIKTASVTSMQAALKSPSDARMAAHRIVGQAMSSSKVGDMITGNPASTNIGSGNLVVDNTGSTSLTITNSSSITANITLTDTFNRVLLAVPDIAIYTDVTTPGTPTISVADQYPNTTYGMGNMPIAIWNDWGLSDNVNVVTRVVIRNNTGSDRKVKIVYRFRIITNASVALGGTATGGTS